MKPVKQFEAVVEEQHPARNEVAQLTVVGKTFGTYEEVWNASKKMTRFPVITMKEVHHGTQC